MKQKLQNINIWVWLLVLLAAPGAGAQTPVPLASQSGFTYTENFSDIANWSNNFASGTGANRFASVAVGGTATIPDPTRITTSSASFASSTSGGVQRGTGTIVLLSTGATDNSSSVAIDFFVDFTSLKAGNLSFDAATVPNSTGNRLGTVKVYGSVNGTTFTDLGANYTATNNVAGSSAVSVALPSTFDNAATVRFRIYYHNGGAPAGTTGSRPKISIDNLTVTGTAQAPSNPTVNLSVDKNTVTENPAQTVTVTATASAPVSGQQTVDLTPTGSATNGNDYFIGSNGNTVITIPDGQTSGSITFTVINDTDVEGNEAATLTLANPSSGIALGSTLSQTITITDDDAPAVPVVSIVATDATGAEAGPDPVTFAISRTGDVTNALDVAYTTGGTATNGTDYTPTLTGSVTIPAGQASVDITLTPADDGVVDANETIILTLTDGAAYDLGTASASATATITDNDVAPATRIRDIQGVAHISPQAGQAVTNVTGTVTVLRSNGFWMQDPSPDADDNTSEGIFVFTSAASGRTVGESVLVNGTVQEFRANVQNLSITQITNPSVSVVSAGNALPDPVVISSQAGTGVRRIPTNVISNDFPTGGDVELSTFDPAEDGLDFFETLEGMRVQINNPVTTSLRSSFGEVFVIADAGAGATGLNARGSLTISGTNTTDIASAITNSDFNPERIQIDDVLYGTGNTPNENVGTKLNTIIGVVSYDFQSYEILPSVAPTVSSSNVPLAKETTNLVPTTNQLTVASFNVENLGGNELQAKYDGLAVGIRTNLGSPDILALEEIQDNNGATNDGVVDATTTLDRLVAAITAAGGPAYQYRQINPVDDQDGGQPGGNIRVGILFNPARVQFVDRAGGGSTTNTTVSNVGGQPRISASPGRILDTNPGESDSFAGDDFTSTRKPLVGELTFNGQPVYLIVNHFSSRGGSGALSQRFQPPIQEEQGRREEQGKVVNAFVDQLLAVNASANVVVLGDFNEFQFLPALQYLKGNVNGETPVLTNLIESLPAQERYTYTFDGNAQALDYILGSNAMNSKLDAFDAVHINAEFLDQLSDHDPSVARFNFAPAATALSLNFMANPTQILTTGTTTLSAAVSGGTTPYGYTFSGPGTITPNGNTASVSGLSAGIQTFTVVVTDAVSQTISGTVSVTVTEPAPTNTAPTTTGIANQTATVNQPFSLNVAPSFTDAETPNGLTFAAAGLPDGLAFSGSTISGTPSTSVGSPFTITIKATDPGSLSVSTPFMLTVNPATGGGQPFSITAVTTVSCETISTGERRVSFTPQYSGTNGQPISFRVVNELSPTTAPGPYTLRLYTDNPTIALRATQSGTAGEASFTYNWLAACNGGGTPPPSPTAPFAITAVTTVSCEVVTTGQRRVSFTPQYSGTNGQPISFRVVNELSPTTAPGPYTLRLYTDNPTIALRATQSGSAGESSFTYNWLAACNSASGRLGVTVPTESVLDIRVIGNPVQNGQVSAEVRGAAGQPLRIQLTDMRGQIIGAHTVEQAGSVEQHVFEIGRQPTGLLLLRATTPTRSRTVKVMKAD